MRTLKIVAPSHWASYLINGDASGLDTNEKAVARSRERRPAR